MKPLNVAFIWHMHQRYERKPCRFPLIGPLNGRLTAAVNRGAVPAGFAALLTFVGMGLSKWILVAHDGRPGSTRGRGRGELGRPGHAFCES